MVVENTFIYTDDETLVVDVTDCKQLEDAIRFKAEHIRAKAEPELFEAVADAMKNLREYKEAHEASPSPSDYWRKATAVMEKQRAKGLKEYGQTLEDNTELRSPLLILEEAEQELVDGILYLEHLRKALGG